MQKYVRICYNSLGNLNKVHVSGGFKMEIFSAKEIDELLRELETMYSEIVSNNEGGME